MQGTRCECLIYHRLPQLLVVIKEVVSLTSSQTLPILSRNGYDKPGDPPLPCGRDVNVAEELLGERIVQAAVKNHGARATVLRIGQVVGDTKVGVWKDTEAFPLIIRSAVTMSILPNIDMTCQWLPVDT